MFSFDKHDVQRVAVSTIAALALSATCVFAAVAPAKAGVPTTLPAWQAQVEQRIARAPGAGSEHGAATAQRMADVTLRFDADGAFSSLALTRSSGEPWVDARAMELAAGIHYPPLPLAARGMARIVVMRLALFDPALTPKARVDVVAAPAPGIQVAAR